MLNDSRSMDLDQVQMMSNQIVIDKIEHARSNQFASDQSYDDEIHSKNQTLPLTYSKTQPINQLPISAQLHLNQKHGL